MSNYVWPVPGGRLSSRFGPRKPPKPGASSYHNGIDIAASAGAPIIAARPGKVILKSYNSARGNYIKIDHGGGIVTLYQHAKSFSVSSGTKVSAGQVWSILISFIVIVMTESLRSKKPFRH